jgi:hypothetical protein
MVDALGIVVPRHLRDNFGLTPFSEEPARLRQLYRQVRQMFDRWAKYVPISKLGQYLNGAADLLEMARPYAVCAKCQGKGCRNCLITGYLTKARLEELELMPEE